MKEKEARPCFNRFTLTSPALSARGFSANFIIRDSHSSNFPLLWCLNSLFSCLNMTLQGPQTSNSRGWPTVTEARFVGQGRAAVSKSILQVGYTLSVTAFLFVMSKLANVVSGRDLCVGCKASVNAWAVKWHGAASSVALLQCSRGSKFSAKCLFLLPPPCRWRETRQGAAVSVGRRCCILGHPSWDTSIGGGLPCHFLWHWEASLQWDLWLSASSAWLSERIYPRVLFPFLQQFFYSKCTKHLKQVRFLC